MLTVAISKRNKLQNIIVLTPKDGFLCRTMFGCERKMSKYNNKAYFWEENCCI